MSKTHKQWMRECIEECKTCGNLNTASGAERLIEKFAEHMDESGGGSGGGALNVTVMVTESDANTGIATGTSDVAGEEIIQAFNDGKGVRLAMGRDGVTSTIAYPDVYVINDTVMLICGSVLYNRFMVAQITMSTGHECVITNKTYTLTETI